MFRESWSLTYNHYAYANVPVFAYSFHKLATKPFFRKSSPLFHNCIRKYSNILTLCITMAHITVNKVSYVIEWGNFRKHCRRLKCVNRLLLSERSYNVSSVRSGVKIVVSANEWLSKWVTTCALIMLSRY